MSTLSTLWEALDVALAAAQTASEALDATAGSGGAVVDAVAKVDSAAATAQARAKDLASFVRGLSAEDAIAAASLDATAEFAWVESSAQILLHCLEVREGMRALRAAARSRVIATAKIYRVKPGDTLDGIAQAELGGRGRAADLHLTSNDLQPGRLIRLPA